MVMIVVEGGLLLMLLLTLVLLLTTSDLAGWQSPDEVSAFSRPLP